MIAILDLAPEIADKPPLVENWTPEHVPTDTELLGYASWSIAQSPVKLLKATRATIGAGLLIRQRNRTPDVSPPPTPFTAPRTSLNDALTARRAFRTGTVPLSGVKHVKNAFGTTVNDVVLALCGGALRHYLDEAGEHVERALVAMVPISVRTPDGKGAMGNQVSSALTTLATDVDDPVARLATISEGMRNAKVQQDAIGAETLQDWAEFAAPRTFGLAVRAYAGLGLADRLPVAHNLVISNVPGPPFPLYVAGARVASTFPVGPIFDGAGVNMTVMSYLDALDFGVNVCPDLVPDPDRLIDGLLRAYDELAKAADEAIGTAEA
jgi:diacylglycerol O-acyltransferase